MERKLLTILFVDLVDSTRMVTGADPEVVRRRVTGFIEHASNCIAAHGGTVRNLAGDALMAAFGIPQTHEDDAERAVRAGLSILEAVRDLDLEARVGVEAGEVVTDENDTTFATGEAINIAVRLQQAADPGQLLIGPAVYRLTVGRVEVEDVGPVALKGIDRQIWAWHVTQAVTGLLPQHTNESPLVGREEELELLQNTFSRVARDSRAHLFTVYGEPGVGKSRLAREFVESLEGVTVLAGRSLPYGEGITYWPLAEMVKVAAGITDDDPVREAMEKLRACCEDEAIADLLALASGVLEAVEGERSQQEIAWAAREWAEKLADAQPLILVFEDIHWAEEPLLELIEHLAEWVRDAPLLLLCLARPELLDIRSGWGGGRLRATALEVGPLVPRESEELIEALSDGRPMNTPARELLVEKTGGNPLFLEETIRMLLEQDGGEGLAERIPDTVQALIAARIDRLNAAEKTILQRAAVIGRVFWGGAIAHLAPELENMEELLEDLLQRDFLLLNPRSSISGETAYRFKHELIREVAYGGLSKSARAEHHRRLSTWLRDRAGDELIENRAYHLERAASLLAELDGSAPAELAGEAAAALELAGKRALAREDNRSARKLLLRSVELEPTLDRRFKAARAAWRLTDIPVVSVEMETVRAAAREAGEHRIEARALIALAEVALYRDGDVDRSEELGGQALSLLDASDDEGRYDALEILAMVGWWIGDLGKVEKYAREMLEIGQRTGRKNLESQATIELASIYEVQLDDEKVDPLLERAAQLAEESGSLVARAHACYVQGDRHLRRHELDEAEAALESARELFSESGAASSIARTLNHLALVATKKGDLARAERLLREAARTLTPLEDRGVLVEIQRALAEVLLEQGKVDEAERWALAARQTVTPQDKSSLASTSTALALVRAAQARYTEAERLFHESLDILAETDFRSWERKPLRALVAFLHDRGRDDEAAAYEGRLQELSPPTPTPTPPATPTGVSTWSTSLSAP